jgi:hypothetical protein
MDFQQLLSKMVELDQPAAEAMDAPVAECPPSMGPAEPPMGGMQQQQPPAHPSMSVNLNAQGMDDIAELMKLMTKVNPDMINQPQGGMPPMPSMGMEPSITSIKPAMPPLKMLPDFDADNNDMPGGEKDMPIKGLDQDGDGDHDMDDHDMEKKKDKEEAFGNSLDDSEPATMDTDAAIPSGNDLHKQKSMHRAAAGGDNPMKAESGDLRAQIRAELLQRLAEAKGAK